jgi:hypothetical protein
VEDPVAAYQPNNLDLSSPVSYYGYTDAAGAYWLKRLDETTNPATLGHATVLLNPGTLTYTTAWTNRATLVYGRYDQAF